MPFRGCKGMEFKRSWPPISAIYETETGHLGLFVVDVGIFCTEYVVLPLYGISCMMYITHVIWHSDSVKIASGTSRTSPWTQEWSTIELYKEAFHPLSECNGTEESEESTESTKSTLTWIDEIWNIYHSSIISYLANNAEQILGTS
jgi:hypothetical protein